MLNLVNKPKEQPTDTKTLNLVDGNTTYNVKRTANQLKPIVSGLNITIKTLRSGDNIPFILKPSINGELTMLVDESILSAILNEQAIVTKQNEDGSTTTIVNPTKLDKTQDPLGVLTTKEALLELDEFPSQLVQYLDIVELEIISQPEHAIVKYDNSALKSILESFISDKKAIEDEAKRNNITCKPCTIGALNRRYLLKILQHLPGHSIRLEFYKDLFNMFHCETPIKSMQYIKNETLRSINDAYFKELAEVENKPGCSKCMQNGVKTKYNTTLTQILKNRKQDLLLSYE